MENEIKKQNAGSMVRDLTNGGISKNIFIYAWPLLIANSLQAVYNIVDMLVVGRVEGQIGLAAVSVGADLMFLLVSLLIGFSNAGQVLIAQFTGAGESKRVSKLIGTMYVTVFIFSVVIAIICALADDWLLGLLNTPEAAYKEARSYFLICGVGGIVFSAGYNVTCAILRGMGNSKQPCIFIAIAAVLNIILDIWFVAYLHMGAAGAALATVIGQGLSFIVAIIYLYRHKEEFGFDFKLKSFRIEPDVFRPLVRLGIPMSIQMASINISKVILASWINACGVVYTALAGVYNKLSMMVNILANSLMTAGGTIVGQNIGARKYDRVKKTIYLVLLYSGAIMAVFIALFLIFPTSIFELFTSDAEVISTSSILVLPIVINFLGVVGRCYAFSLINGSGNSRLNLIVALLDGILARIFFAYFFGFVQGLSAQGFWLGDAIAGNVPFFIGLVFYLSKKWQKRSN